MVEYGVILFRKIGATNKQLLLQQWAVYFGFGKRYRCRRERPSDETVALQKFDGKWDCGSMRIIMPIEFNGERLDVPCKMAGFRLMCNGIDTSPLEVFESVLTSVLTRGGMLTPDDCNALKEKGYDGDKTGQKIGRAINAWSTAHRPEPNCKH